PRLIHHSFPTRRSSDLGEEVRKDLPNDLLVIDDEDAWRLFLERILHLPSSAPVANDTPRPSTVLLQKYIGQRVGIGAPRRGGRRDRKSTRLNSSHLGIS